jgi:hypothetical protein
MDLINQRRTAAEAMESIEKGARLAQARDGRAAATALAWKVVART